MALWAAELRRPLLGLIMLAGVAVMTSGSGFFDAFPTYCDAARFGPGGGVGGTRGTDFACTGGGGVGTGGRLASDACEDGCRFVDKFVSSVAVSIFGVVSGFPDLSLGLLTTVGLTFVFLTPFNVAGSFIPVGGGGGPGDGAAASIAFSSCGFRNLVVVI